VSDAPIGIFDSGLGGLTVARAVLDQLPGEAVLYLGDTAHTPYGPRPIAEVRALALAGLDRLVDAGVKLLVIACNTASAAVLADARERYEQGRGVPVLEVIRPAVRRAVGATRTGRVGVIGTQTTIESGAYDDAFAAAPHLRLTSQACPRFVELVEAGSTSGPEVIAAARRYLAALQEARVDTLVLGCTHYPLLTGVLSYVMGPDVTLVSSAEETAKDVFGELVASDLLRRGDSPPSHRFCSTGDQGSFARLARRFLGPEAPTWEAADQTLPQGIPTVPGFAPSAFAPPQPAAPFAPDAVPSSAWTAGPAPAAVGG
jgi:glutamate racemase